MSSLKLVFVLLFSISLTNLNASHITGGQIGYTPTGVANQYELTLTLYRDCSGIPAPPNATIIAANDCGLSNPTIVLPLVSSSQISQLCPAAISSSSCNGGTLPGIEKYIYSGLITLTDTCDAWTFSFQSCNRNASVNLVGAPCYYIETIFNNASFPFNSSPVITNLYQVPYVCNTIPVDLSLYVIDQNGDDLNFTFINAMSDAGVNIPYVSGFTATQPIPGITMDPNTGQIQFTPAIVGNFVVTILIEELDANGNIIGSIMHDFEFFVETCSNTPPTGASNITNFDTLGTNAFLDSNNVINMCSGDAFCFDFVFSDSDLSDTVTLTSDIASILPGATFTQTGTNPVTAHVCWTYTPTNLGTSFSIQAADNYCPVPGVASETFQLNLPPPLGLISDTIVFCVGQTPLTIINNNSSSMYWTTLSNDTLVPGSMISCNPCNNPILYFDTLPQVIVTLNDYCNTSDTITLINLSPNPIFSNDTTGVCPGDSLVFYAPLNSGSIVNLWNSMTIADSLIIIPTTNDSVSLMVTDTTSGCYGFFQTYIDLYTVNTPTINTNATSLSTGSYSTYQWFFNGTPIVGANGQNHLPLNNGDYHVEVTDINGCSSSSAIQTIGTASISDTDIITNIFKSDGLIQVETVNDNQQIEVLDLAGRRIYIGQIKSGVNLIQIPNTSQILLVSIIDSSGKIILAKKL